MSLDETMEWAHLPGYVEQADGDDIRLCLLDERQAAALHDLGFLPGPTSTTLSRSCPEAQDKARVFAQLQQLGWAFAAGREWSPAEVFEHWREQGLLHGSYRRLAWVGPNDPQLSMA